MVSGSTAQLMLTVYMDESGYTGEDLLNADQPIFVHVSNTLSDDEAAALYHGHFSGTQGNELKHRNLAKWPSGQERIANLVSALSDSGKCTAFLCHKEFTALTYLVDLWVEPAMHIDGIDLYKDGANLGLCNMSYVCLRSYQGPQFLTGHLRRFQQMMIARTQETYRDFWGALTCDYQSVDKRTRDILTFFLGGELRLGPPALLGMPERALDPAFTTALETCSYWRSRTDDPIRLVHDKSSSLAKDKPLWELLTSPDIERRTIGIPGRQIRYPLSVVATEFADSRSHLQLQFCDLVAGAAAAWSRQFLDLPHAVAYAKRLEQAGIEALVTGQIWPQAEIDPERLGMKGWSGEGIDFLTEQLEKLDPASSEDDH